MKRWIIAAAALAGLMVFPGTAAASVCGDDGATQFFDSQGYYFDFAQSSSTAADHNDPFGTLRDSGSNGPTDTPPGPVSNSDTYDHWGQLFVGGTDNSHMYWSPDNNSCTDPVTGERDFPVVSLAGLQVQRKIFVNPTSGSLPGARILDLISNPGGSPVTTTVQVGDLTSGDNDGDLGSDDTTAVRASSNGDTVASSADLWAVTNDDPVSNSDNTIAHIADGQGAAVKTSFFQVGGGTAVTEQPEDNVAWGWTVTIPAGGTVGLMSFEVQQAVADLAGPPAVANAVTQANAYENAPLSTLYQGMSPTEQQSVANWNASNAFTANVKGKKLIVSVSAPGTVAVTDAKAKSTRSAESAKKKGGPGLKSSSATGSPPQIKVKLKLTKSAQSKLRSKGKVSVKAKITFTPNRGFASTQTKKLKIKSKGNGKGKGK